MTLKAQLGNRTLTTPSRREHLEGLHDRKLDKITRVVNEGLKRAQQISFNSLENISTSLVTNAFQEGGLLSESKSKARYENSLQLVTEHSGKKKLRNDARESPPTLVVG